MLTVLTNIRSTKVLRAMPHSDFLPWLSSATLKYFISGVSTRILMLLKANLIYSLSRLRRRPRIEDNLKNEDDLKNDDNLRNEDDLKIKTASKMKTT